MTHRERLSAFRTRARRAAARLALAGAGAARQVRTWTQGHGLTQRLARAATRLRDRSGASRWSGRTARLRPPLRRLAQAVGLRGWRYGLALVASGVGILLLASLGLQPAATLEMPAPSRPHLIGFYENSYSKVFGSSFGSVQANSRYLNTVLAFWYSVDGSGKLHSRGPSTAVAAWVKAHHLRMGVLINNIPGTSGTNAGMLTNPAARARAVAAIVKLVRAQGYQEVNIDFELIKPSTSAALVAFMGALRHALPASVTLSESVFPKIGVASSINGAYNYTALAKVVNYLVIMLYDQHYNGSNAGPVSPYPWVVANVNWFLHTAHIPPAKLVLAAGVYGYDWPKGSTQAQELPLNAVLAEAAAHHATIQMDRPSQNPYFTYTAGGHAHIVWFQDQQTMLQRLQLAKKLGLRGVAIWALGQETPAVWQAVAQAWGPAS